MILYKIQFGSPKNSEREEAKELIEYYISALLHNGQACGEYFTVLQSNKLCAYVIMQSIKANAKNNHCQYGIKWLIKVEEFFGVSPTWELIDDDVPKQKIKWDKAPFLYLYTNLNEWVSPICRGDTGEQIPVYLLPGEHEDREKINFWQRSYQSHDSIWMGCGELEIATYKQLATPFSGLAEDGREICAYIEKITGIPTYYYLMRYWGRRTNEERRKCPGCGNKWHIESKSELDPPPFFEFDFMCEKCRLVSHISSSDDDERHAVIGEWRKPNKNSVVEKS